MKQKMTLKKFLAMNPALMAPKSKGKVFETALENYFELTQKNELKELVAKIRQTENHDERRELKTSLPIRCPHYFKFADNRRAQSAILPEEFTFQTCVDIDDASQVESALSRAYLLNNNKGEWQGKLLHVERSASGKLHLDIRIPVGMTIREAQEAYTKALGVDFDEDCCTPERMIYITDVDSQLYTSDDWYVRLSDEEIAGRRKAYADRGLDIDGRELKTQPSSTELKTQPSGAEGKISLGYPTTYAGVPYLYIIEELADQLGGEPEHGNRNAFIYSMACHLRHICNDDPKWIQQVMPNYGEAQERVNDTIASACKRNQSKTTPQKIKAALLLAQARVNLENGQDPDSVTSQPKMPMRLPAPVRHLLSKAPMGYWPAIINTAFAALATYTGGVKAEFWNGRLTELTLIEGVVAPMSSGKSSIKDPISHILKPIEMRDILAREKEKEWADATCAKSANSDKEERPKDICVQIVDSDMTNAAFCQRSEDAERAGDKALFTIMDEMEELRKVSSGSTSEVTQIIRRDFDTDKYGQERVGTQSVKVRTTLRWNIVFSTTPHTAKAFFDGNIDNGTLSRINFSTIVKEDVERRPKFGRYDETYDKKLNVYLARLEATKGSVINCPQAKKLAENLLDRAEERALMMGDNESYVQLSYRAVEIAFRKSILLYIMCGMKWTKEIEEFIIWSFDYDMWVKMCLFGNEITQKLENDHRIMKPGVPCMLEQLNDSFTTKDFEVIYRSQNLKGKPGNLLSKWKARGWIEEDKTQQMFIKTEAYYQKHAA